MDPDLATLGDDPDKLKFYARRYQNKAHKHEAEIDELQYRISVLTKQLEEERARKQDANASGTTPLNGANAPTSAPGPSRSRGTTAEHGLTTPPPSAGRSSSSSPDVEEGKGSEGDDENSASIAQRVQMRKRRSQPSPCAARSTRKRVVCSDSEDEDEFVPVAPPRRKSKRTKVEVIATRSSPETRRQRTAVSRTPSDKHDLPGQRDEDGEEESVLEEEAKDDDDYEFGCSTLSELSESEAPSRPQSPIQGTSEEAQEGLTPAQASKDGAVPMDVDPTPVARRPSQRFVYHLRSPSRELSYFDPEEERAAGAGASSTTEPVQSTPEASKHGQAPSAQPDIQSIPPPAPQPIPQPTSGAGSLQQTGSMEMRPVHSILTLVAEAGLANVVFRPILRLRSSPTAPHLTNEPSVGAPSTPGMHPSTSPAAGSPPSRLPRSSGEQIISQRPVTHGLSRTVPVTPERNQGHSTVPQQTTTPIGVSPGSTDTSTSTQSASTPNQPNTTTHPPPSPAPAAFLPQPEFEQVSRRPCMPLVIAGLRIKCIPPLMSEEAAADRLSGCRQFDVPVIDPELRSVTTSRSVLNGVFGGGLSQFSTVANNGDNFLFPKLEMQPNLPHKFGMPGLLCSASLMREWKGERQKLFICIRDRHYWYVGDYVLRPALALSADEYRAWSKEMKHKNIAISAIGDKNKYDDLRDSEIIQAYEEGRETMFVWTMQCVAFDVKFLQDIHEQHNNYVPTPRVKKEKKPATSNSAPAS